jgi:hypothetical protein
MPSYNDNSDVEQLQHQIDKTTDNSLGSTRRMVNMCVESEEAGTRTLGAIAQQGEQLNKIEEDMDTIRKDVREADKALTGMEKCCGVFSCPCSSSNVKVDRKDWKDADSIDVVDSQPKRGMNGRNDAVADSSGAYINKITNDAREDEMEDNLQQVGNMLGNLKNMAIDMGQGISTQNAQISRITNKADILDGHIGKANQRANKLINN